MTDLLTQAVPGPVRVVHSLEDLEALKRSILLAHEIVFDLETTGLDPHAQDVIEHVPKMVGRGKARHEEIITRVRSVQARVALAQFTLPLGEEEWDGAIPVTWLLPLSHSESWLGKWVPDVPGAGPPNENWRKVLRQVLRAAVEAKKPFSGHNIKFDAKYSLATTGIDISSLIIWDTSDASRVLDAGISAKLGDVCERELGIPSWKDLDFKTPGAAEVIPLPELLHYGALDTWACWLLGQRQRRRMFLLPAEGSTTIDEPLGDTEILEAKAGKLATWVAMPTVRSLTQIENRGIRLDVDHTRALRDEARRISAERLDQMAHWYPGIDPAGVSTAPTSHWFRDFTLRGIEEGELQMIEVTPTGKPRWTKGVLKKIAAMKGPESLAAVILEQRKFAKRLEYLEAWLSCVTSHGYIHTTYNTGMVTGRLSSSGPNMQQVTKELRPCFIPRDGYVVADFDFSQIEMRVAAFIARSEPMLEAFNQGQDLHRLLAAQVARKLLEDVTPDERQMAKAVNFGLLFGLGAFGLRKYAEDSYDVVMSQEEANRFYRGYFETWTGLREWHLAVEARLRRDGISVSPLGRVRGFSNWGDPNTLNAAINAPVQGMASDLMQIAIAEIQGQLPGANRTVPEALVIATVHDSAVIELPEDRWQETAQLIKATMEDPAPVLKNLGVELDVPIVVEASIGTRWSLSDVGKLA
jgi:DNA polymerase-1